MSNSIQNQNTVYGESVTGTSLQVRDDASRGHHSFSGKTYVVTITIVVLRRPLEQHTSFLFTNEEIVNPLTLNDPLKAGKLQQSNYRTYEDACKDS